MESRTYSISIIIPIGSKEGVFTALRNVYSILENEKIHIIFVLDFDNPPQELMDNLKAFNLEIVLSKSRSPGGARNAGLQRVKGEFVTFWDSDDVVEISNFIEVLETAIDLQLQVICSPYMIYNVDYNTSSFQNIPPKNMMDLVWSPGLWRFIFKYDVVEGFRFPDLCMGEDQIYLAQINIFDLKIFHSKVAYYKYIKGKRFQITAKPDKYSRVLETLNYLSIHNSNYSKNLQTNKDLEIVSARLALTLLIRSPKYFLLYYRGLVALKQPLFRSLYLLIAQMLKGFRVTLRHVGF